MNYANCYVFMNEEGEKSSWHNSSLAGHHSLLAMISIFSISPPSLLQPFAAATLPKGLQCMKAKGIQDDPNNMAQIFCVFWGPVLL